MSKESEKDIIAKARDIVQSNESAGKTPAAEETSHPLDVDPFFQEAQTFVAQIQDQVQLTSAILDDWNTGEGVKGARIIYGAPCVAKCNSQCLECSLFRIVGEDNAGEKKSFRSSLCRATEGQLNLFPSKEKYLNCKTVEEYLAAFIIWIVEKCDSEELLKAELDWVKGFRVLFLDGNYDPAFLKEKEKEFKAHILNKSLDRLREKMDLHRVRIVLEYGKQMGTL